MVNIMKLNEFNKLSPRAKQQYIDSLSAADALKFMHTLGFNEGYKTARKHAHHLSSVEYYQQVAKKQTCLLTFLLLIIVYLVLGMLVFICKTKTFFYLALVFGTFTTLTMFKNIYPILKDIYFHGTKKH